MNRPYYHPHPAIKCHTHPKQGADHTYFLLFSEPKSGVEGSEYLGEGLSVKERESQDARSDPPSDCSIGPVFDFETKGTEGHQVLAHRITEHVN